MINLLFVGSVTSVSLPSVEYSSILPQLLLIGGALSLLLFSSLTRDGLSNAASTTIATLMTVGALFSTIWMWDSLELPDGQGFDLHSTIGAAIANDHLTVFAIVGIGVALLLSIWLSYDWLDEHDFSATEYLALMMLSAVGGMFMAAANDLMVVFIALEILSIALYVLVGFRRSQSSSREAALKYFILGSFAAAVMLFGFVLIYGATGTTNIAGITTFMTQNVVMANGLLLAGIALALVGFGFKIAAVPFHQWSPDVYQGAPAPVTAFMAAAVKVAALIALTRVLVAVLPASADWTPIVLTFALASLFVGAIGACVQANVKRMLAYSSIGHVGFILLALHTVSPDGMAAVLYYALIYVPLIVGSFAVVHVVGGQSSSRSGLEAFRGLARREPAYALSFVVLLLAQAGLPLTTGFLAKFYVMTSVIAAGSYWIAIVGLIAAAVTTYAYLRVVVMMFRTDDDDAQPVTKDSVVEARNDTGVAFRPGLGTAAVVVLCAVLTVSFGVLPSSMGITDLVSFARHAAADLFPTELRSAAER